MLKDFDSTDLFFLVGVVLCAFGHSWAGGTLIVMALANAFSNAE